MKEFDNTIWDVELKLKGMKTLLAAFMKEDSVVIDN